MRRAVGTSGTMRAFRAAIAGFAALLMWLAPTVAGAQVLRVGTYQGIPGQFSSIQAAVNQAKPGDVILVGPGDYKTSSSRHPAGQKRLPAGVLITKPHIYLRGMNRNTVIVDGTKPGSAKCSAKKSAQNFGSRRSGLNGIMVWKANGVWVQNLTTCNFLGGKAKTGNEIWWNGGAGSGHIDGHGYSGAYLTATSRYFGRETSAAKYGIFTSDWRGGTLNQSYASNFNDSGFYIGACAVQCYQTMDHDWAQYSALGYSGTNSGGPLLIEHSEFDHNEEGFDSNSQNNDDWPSPQSGQCPAGVKPQIAGAHSCWIFYKNSVHDNNNPNVPASGPAAAAPVGTGLSIEGRDDTVMDNTFSNQGAWGAVFQPYPDTENPPSDAPACRGGISHYVFLGINIKCLYDDWNDAMVGNTFTHNGYFGNPSNGDIAETTFIANHPVNCFSANKDSGGSLTSSPSTLQSSNATCGPVASTPDQNLPYVFQALCDTQVFGPKTPCVVRGRYPRRARVVMHPLPKGLKSMPNPCAGVPKNPWCPTHKGYAARAKA